MTDVLHPNGRCTCASEGRCDWCQRTDAELEERIEKNMEALKKAPLISDDPDDEPEPLL